MEPKVRSPMKNIAAVWVRKDAADMGLLSENCTSIRAGSPSSATNAEADIQRSVKAIVRELDQRTPGGSSSRGMFRWTLHKKSERDPYNSIFLVKNLISELELAKKDNKHYILPLLNILMYTVIQAAYIPDDLHEKAYKFCKGLLSFAKPYCTIAHEYAVMLKAERKAPGVLYQRLIISEHGLKNDTSPHWERVFVLADPDLISEEVCNALYNEIHSMNPNEIFIKNMGHVIKHTIQAALGETCNINRLDEVLQVRKELVQFVKSRGGSSQDYLNSDSDNSELSETTDSLNIEQTRLSVLSNDSGIVKDCGDLPLANDMPAAGPSEKEQTKFVRKACIKKKSYDSENTLNLSDIYDTSATGGTVQLQRKFGCNTMLFNFKQQKPHTARVVVLGNDCVLGRLAKAVLSIRKRETRRCILTSKLNLQFYYIPVTNEEQTPVSVSKVIPLLRSDFSCEMSRYLGSIDPWYNSNINSLRDMIPELAKTSTPSRQQPNADPFILDVTSYYVRMGYQPVCFQIYSVMFTFIDKTTECVDDVFLIQLDAELPELKYSKEVTLTRKRTVSEGVGVQIAVTYKKIALSNRESTRQFKSRCTGLIMKTIPSTEAEDLVCLNVTISEVTNKLNLSGKISLIENNKIKTSHIKIEIQDTLGKSLIVCLDKDSRRIYKDVVSIEVSPCLEPGYSFHKMRSLRFGHNGMENVGLTKYMPKSLLLPINTFVGIL
ncbi:hypothetical protein chiPu_0010014 [Chiloscyllium punctatum]|uniref:Phosphoinositide 3-kinase regulatory subunit 6 n=1 Tax=Chiloscyllium punctatum TaxID=137246 RepID=A0A401SMC8_CHIPU|nr:hypothetical protein [Chiloscyllium punctatum]